MASITIQATDGSGAFSAYLLQPKTQPAAVANVRSAEALVAALG